MLQPNIFLTLPDLILKVRIFGVGPVTEAQPTFNMIAGVCTVFVFRGYVPTHFAVA
jgi:hypothetical protein